MDTTGYAQRDADGTLHCGVCPHRCRLADGDRGLCGVRERQGDRIRLLVMDRPSALAADPIEKKPLHHFLPGSGVLSLGTIGCNLDCACCQNHHIARERDPDSFPEVGSAAVLAEAAFRLGYGGVALTYNEPVVWLEYAVAVAAASRALGLSAIAVSAGYVHGQARADLFAAIDAANIDLKGFSEAFYRSHCHARLAPVLDTLRWLKHESPVWLEVTTLVIPGLNDGEAELRAQFRWMADELGVDVPLHLSAFHPDHRLREVVPTPAATLLRAREWAQEAGLRFVYCGNIGGRVGSDTRCPGCGAVVIGRDGWRIDAWRLRHGRCLGCGAAIPGRFNERPGGWSGPPRVMRLDDRSAT